MDNERKLISLSNSSKVYVTVFLLENLQLLLYGNNKLSIISGQGSSLTPCCYGNTTTDDIHCKLAGKGFFTDKQPEKQEDKETEFPLKLEFITEPLPPHGSQPSSPEHKSEKKAGIKLRVHGLALELKLSSVTALSEFIEDEIVNEIVPMSVDVTDLLLTLIEDRPTLNVDAPMPPPQNIHINKLSINQTLDGIFHITALSADEVRPGVLASNSSASSETSFKSSMITLQSENYKLLQKLAEMNRIKKDNETLTTKLSLTTSEFEKLRNENITLADRVKSLTSKLSNVPSTEHIEAENLQLHERLSEVEEKFESTKNENETLQKTLKFLQNELLAAEKRYQNKFAETQQKD